MVIINCVIVDYGPHLNFTTTDLHSLKTVLLLHTFSIQSCDLIFSPFILW